MDNTRPAKASVYVRAAEKGVSWLLDLTNSDGSIGPVEDRLYYYRVPWTLALAGKIEAASRVLDWISDRMFTPQGAFEGVSPQGLFDERYGSYPLACLIVGADILRRFDLVYPGVKQLLSWQDPESGGLYDIRRGAATEREQELFPACQAGMTFLMVGEIEAARNAAAWVERLWRQQPDSEAKLYHVWRPDKGLVMDYPPDQAAWYVTQKQEPWQLHYNGGIAAAFLSKLYMATGEFKWLALAREYQRFSMTTDECQFKSMQTCKSGWGSGLLFVATREQPYLDWTVRMGDWFVRNQFEDGHWENTKYWTPNPTTADNIEMTAEFALHLMNIVSYVSVA